MNTFMIQQKLFELGHYKGLIDGALEWLTRKALKAFQEAIGLEPTGTLNQETEQNLARLTESEPEWLEGARQCLGVVEFEGSANNPVIMEWAKKLKLKYKGDHVAWCGLFVAHFMRDQKYKVPDSPLLARNWLKFGKLVNPQDVRPGDVAVFWRDSIDSWKGHVGFYVGESEGSYLILGGNQSNTVSIKPYEKHMLLAFRRPQ